MDKSLGTLLHFWGVFQFTQVQPLPSPHKQCWTRVSRIYFEFQLFCRVRGGRTAGSFRRGCSFKRGPRNDRKISIINCSTVTRTFVQDCRSIFSGLLALNHLARFCRSEGDSLCTVSMSLLSIPCEILSIIGLRKKWCFANYLGC